MNVMCDKEMSIDMEENREYKVEMICDKRIVNERVEYLVKWKGLAECDNTWEFNHSLVDIECQQLIDAFEHNLAPNLNISSKPQLKTKPEEELNGRECLEEVVKVIPKVNPRPRGRPKGLKNRNNRSNEKPKPIESKAMTESENNIQSNENDLSPKTGFDRNLEAHYICGATDKYGELMFLIKWKDRQSADLVTAKEANIKCPQIVIEFYEKQFRFK